MLHILSMSLSQDTKGCITLVSFISVCTTSANDGLKNSVSLPDIYSFKHCYHFWFVCFFCFFAVQQNMLVCFKVYGNETVCPSSPLHHRMGSYIPCGKIGSPPGCQLQTLSVTCKEQVNTCFDIQKQGLDTWLILYHWYSVECQ